MVGGWNMRDREIARKNQELSMLERSIRNIYSKAKPPMSLS